jgi:DNA-binding HxlR family transcriptional regulator
MMTNGSPSDLEMVEQTHKALTMLDGRWSVDVLYLLAGGRRRYNEIYYEVGEISKKGLTTTLRRLERHGLIDRHVGTEAPPRVEYSLTTLGWSITAPLMALYEWAATHLTSAHPRPELRLAA